MKKSILDVSTYIGLQTNDFRESKSSDLTGLPACFYIILVKIFFKKKKDTLCWGSERREQR